MGGFRIAADEATTTSMSTTGAVTDDQSTGGVTRLHGIEAYANLLSACVVVRLRTCRPTGLPLLQTAEEDEEEESRCLWDHHIISTVKY